MCGFLTICIRAGNHMHGVHEACIRKAFAHLDAPVIYQNIVHLEISILTGFICIIPQECIAQAVTGLLVPDDVTGGDIAEAPKNSFQIFFCGDWVELGNEEHVAWRLGVCFRKVTNHLKHNCPVLGF